MMPLKKVLGENCYLRSGKNTMSKIGKLPIIIGSGVTVTVDGNNINVSGPKGNGTMLLPTGITVETQEGRIQVLAEKLEDRKIKALYGLTRANLANLIKGLDTGFEKQLELVGVGYRAQMQGADLVLSLGFAHPVKFHPRDGVKVNVADNVITISSNDKQLVGEAAATIRKIKPPEPYKGKGIRYKGEKVRRKAGKAAKAAGAK
jgi:large subunit ribosomal protein L6